MIGSAGFGNKSTSGMVDETNLPSDYGSDNRHGGQLGGNPDPYSGINEYGSGTTGGAGFGNKSSRDNPSSSSNGGSYRGNEELGRNLDPYSGHNEFGSGTTGGAGFGNKSTGRSDDTASAGGKSFPSRDFDTWDAKSAGGADSKAGKLMEKIGGMMGNEKLEQKGLEKRQQAGCGSGDYGDSSGNH